MTTLSLIILEICLLFLSVILLHFKNKLAYLGTISLVLSISIPDLYYVPYDLDDLYRYFKEMNVIQSCSNIKSLFYAYHNLSTLIYHKNNYVYDIFQWLISRSGNYALLAFLSIFIVYLCSLIPFTHLLSIGKSDLKTFILGLIIMLSLFPYYNTSSTIRWAIASGIYFLLIYFSFNCPFNPLFTIPLYLIPLFIHQGLIIPIIIVIICIICKDVHIHWYIYIIFGILSAIFLYYVANSSYTSEGSLSNSFQSYNSTDATTFFGGSSFAELTFWIMTLTPFIYAFLSFLLVRDNLNIDFSLEIKMLIFFLVIELLLLPDIAISGRYALDLGLDSSLIYLRTVKYNGVISKKIKSIFFVVSFLAIILVIYSVLYKMNFDFSQINMNGLFDINY